MHQRKHSELQGVSTQQGASTRWTTQDRASRSFRLRRGTGRLRLCPGRGAPLCVWLLLGSLALPGAWSFLSEEQEELLVELHNHYRGQVSPSAAAMMPLKWDPGLKLLAESYAAKCIWNHNPELEDTGENLYAGTGALDLRVALEKWFLEHLDYEFQNNSCDEDKMCGHYTQMVWADTHKVGCAFHLCNSMEGLEWDRVSFLVCNYYPAGNYEDERPYVEGDWCSRCPENLQKCENNLCVADTVEEDEEEEEEEEEEEGEIVVPQTPEISGEPEEEEQVDSAPTTADVQSATTTPPSTTTTTTSKPFVQDSEDDTPPAIPTISTHPATGDEKAEEKVEEEEEEEEEVGKETVDKTEGEHKLDISTYQSKEDTKSSASASSPSILLAAVTVTLNLRL